jgi:hypothetical protein
MLAWFYRLNKLSFWEEEHLHGQRSTDVLEQDNIRYLRLVFVVEDMFHVHEEFSELEKRREDVGNYV